MVVQEETAGAFAISIPISKSTRSPIAKISDNAGQMRLMATPRVPLETRDVKRPRWTQILG